MSKFFEYFMSSLFEITLGFLILAAIILLLGLCMFWPMLVWDLDDIWLIPAAIVNSIIGVSLLFAYMETKADEGG